MVPVRRRSDSEYPGLGVIHAAMIAVLGQDAHLSVGLTPPELARLLGVSERQALVAVGHLAANGLVSRHSGRRWRLTERGVKLLDENRPEPEPQTDPVRVGA